MVSVSGYSNADIVIKPKVIDSLKEISEALDHKEISNWLLGERRRRPEVQELVPRTIGFLSGTEELAQELNGGQDQTLNFTWILRRVSSGFRHASTPRTLAKKKSCRELKETSRDSSRP